MALKDNVNDRKYHNVSGGSIRGDLGDKGNSDSNDRGNSPAMTILTVFSVTRRSRSDAVHSLTH